MGAQGDLFSKELLSELEDNNMFFDNLVNMIPAKLYVSGNTGDEAYNPKYRKGQHKESKEARRARNKQAKLSRYDPTLAESTLETKKRKDQEAYEDSSDSDDDNDHDNEKGKDNVASNEHEEEDESEEANKVSLPSQSQTSTALDENTSGLSRIELLRAKLHAKIAEKQAHSKRYDNKGPTKAPPVEGHYTNPNHKSQNISKRAARRAEKQRRKQLAIANGKRTPTTAGKSRTTEIDLSASNNKSKNEQKRDTTASLKQDLAGINFGSMSGLNQVEYYKDNKSLAGMLNPAKKKKSLDRLLQESQEKQKRLQELKAGNEEDKAKAKKILWGDTLKEATGERKVNDPSKIKKAMKRKANKKAKSAIAWKARMEKTKDSMQERQKLRRHNLDQRKKGGSTGANLSRKRVVEVPGSTGEDGKKKRRMGPYAEQSRAGFEGKKQGFINNKEKKTVAIK